MTKKWVSKYYLKGTFVSSGPDELEQWLEDDQRAGVVNRYHVIRHVDERTDTNKLVVKMVGEFYLVDDLTVHKIFYVNKLRILFSR